MSLKVLHSLTFLDDVLRVGHGLRKKSGPQGLSSPRFKRLSGKQQSAVKAAARGMKSKPIKR